MTPRLWIPGPLRPGDERVLDAEGSHYLCRVLRSAAGEALQVFDGEGARHVAHVAHADPRAARVRVGPALAPLPESPLRIRLAQCLSAGEKMDWTVEKAVELGVAGIAPLLCARSVVRLDGERAARRLEHWRRLVVAACMQCGRDRLPGLQAPVPLADWLAGRMPAAPGLVLAPSAALRLGEWVPAAAARGAPVELDLLVGPESGLTDAELDAARAAGLVPVSLGPRILRTETAGLAAIAALQARLGDL